MDQPQEAPVAPVEPPPVYVPGAPPTIPGQLVNPSRTGNGWPTVLAIIGMVIGAWGIIKAIGAFVTPALQGAFERMNASNPAFAIAKKFEVFTISIGVAQLALSIWLITLCAFLLQRRPTVARGFVFFAVADAVRVVVEIVVQAVVQHQTFGTMVQTSAPGAAMVASITPVILVFGALASLAFGWAFPVFLFIWFRRKAIITQVAAWPLRR